MLQGRSVSQRLLALVPFHRGHAKARPHATGPASLSLRADEHKGLLIESCSHALLRPESRHCSIQDRNYR